MMYLKPPPTGTEPFAVTCHVTRCAGGTDWWAWSTAGEPVLVLQGGPDAATEVPEARLKGM